MRAYLLCTVGFLFARLPSESQAQGTCVSGYLVEASSQAPLRFAAVQLQRDGAGSVADEHGYFELESAAAWDRDSLLVFTQTIRSAHDVAHTRSHGLRLAVAVPPVTPAWEPARPRRKRTSPVAPTPLPATTRAPWGIPGTQYAFFVPNEAPARRATLRTASFYLGDQSLPRETFRVRFYQAAGNRPGAELLLEEVVVLWAPRHNAWYTLDLAPYHLAIPAAGYFVALEYLVESGSLGKYTRPMPEDYTPTGPFMRPVHAAHARTVWRRTAGTHATDWTLLPLDNGLFGRYAAMIKLEVDPLRH